MIAADLLKFFADAAKALTNVGIRMDDCQHLELYSEYRRLMAANNKKTYTIAHLAARHKLSERTVKRIISRFEREL